MCDKFDMSFCFKHCLNGSNVMRDYTDTELCIRCKREDGSCGYCFFELDIMEGSKEHSKWKRLLEDYLCYCRLPKDKSVETKKNLMEFMNEHGVHGRHGRQPSGQVRVLSRDADDAV